MKEQETGKILIGSTIRQKPAIFREFLSSLNELDRSGCKIDCLFIDNNDNEESSELLKQFRMEGATVFLGSDMPTTAYNCSEETHYWNDSLIWKVADYKNFIIEFALSNNYSHLFLIDSDLVLHPKTLQQLLSTGHDIISEIFWTEWEPGTGELPQVWLAGNYSFYIGSSFLPDEEKNRQTRAVLSQLKTPGVYEVGGLGACTLISRNALLKGANYLRINNVDYWGEDRHFCVRAAVLGVKLYVDTHYPAFHIYRESDLPKLAAYKQDYHEGQVSQHTKSNNTKVSPWVRKPANNKVTLSMVVHNESDRYLKEVLEHARQYINSAVIIDDASSDNTAELCREILADLPLTLITRKKSGFSNEITLRKQQWRETVKTHPDWILSLDADEMFEDRIVTELPALINQADFDWIGFRLYDFWDQEHYRDDTYWQAHNYYRPFLVRYVPSFKYRWQETALHCGRLPSNITELPGAGSTIRLKHFGWASPEDREEKYRRYMKLDPAGKYGILEQYNSILDPNPKLVKWEE